MLKIKNTNILSWGTKHMMQFGDIKYGTVVSMVSIVWNIGMFSLCGIDMKVDCILWCTDMKVVDYILWYTDMNVIDCIL